MNKRLFFNLAGRALKQYGEKWAQKSGNKGVDFLSEIARKKGLSSKTRDLRSLFQELQKKYKRGGTEQRRMGKSKGPNSQSLAKEKLQKMNIGAFRFCLLSLSRTGGTVVKFLGPPRSSRSKYQKAKLSTTTARSGIKFLDATEFCFRKWSDYILGVYKAKYVRSSNIRWLRYIV